MMENADEMTMLSICNTFVRHKQQSVHCALNEFRIISCFGISKQWAVDLHGIAIYNFDNNAVKSVETHTRTKKSVEPE